MFLSACFSDHHRARPARFWREPSHLRRYMQTAVRGQRYTYASACDQKASSWTVNPISKEGTSRVSQDALELLAASHCCPPGLWSGSRSNSVLPFHGSCYCAFWSSPQHDAGNKAYYYYAHCSPYHIDTVHRQIRLILPFVLHRIRSPRPRRKPRVPLTRLSLQRTGSLSLPRAAEFGSC